MLLTTITVNNEIVTFLFIRIIMHVVGPHEAVPLLRSLELLVLGLLVAAALGEDVRVVLLEEAQVLAGLGELTLLHTLADVPVHEGALRVHQVKLGDEALAEHAADGDVVRDHDDVPRGVGDVVALDADRGLVVQADLETGGAPVDEGDLVVGLDPLGDLVGLLGADVTAVVDGDGHVLVLGDVEVGVLDEERGRVEGVVRDVLDGDGLEVLAALGLGQDGRDGRVHEVEARERDQVRLELVHVNVQLTVEPERGGHGGHGLGHDTVHVAVGGALHLEVALEDLVDGLVVEDQGHLGVVEEQVGGEEAVVGLDDHRREVGRGVDLEADLGLLAVVHGEALEHQATEARARASADGVVDDETLDVLRVVRALADELAGGVDVLLADVVVATGEVVRGVLVGVEQELGVVQVAEGALANLVNDGGLEVNGHLARDEVLVGGVELLGVLGLEEREQLAVLRVVVALRVPIGVDVVLLAVLGPDGVAILDTALSNRDGDNFANHVELKLFEVAKQRKFSSYNSKQ